MTEHVSIVIPFYNERDSLEDLAAQIAAAMEPTDRTYEVLFVNDGSSDGGEDVIQQLCETTPEIKLIDLMRNFGKAAALSAGFRYAKGDVVITMDADLQDDPAEIPRFLEKLDEGFDVVSGWKKTRHDPIGKTLPSKFFNFMVRKAFSLDLHDVNCGFKAYRRRAVKSLRLYGELHRFTPALLQGAGFRIAEIAVQHHPREHGVSKYGLSRILKGLLDIMTVLLLTRYQARPLHFFGYIGFAMALVGGAMLVYLTILWFMGLGPIGNRPLLFLGILLVMTATQLISVGLIAELFRTSHMSEDQKYVIDRLYGIEE